MCEVLDRVEARGEARGRALGEARGVAKGEAMGRESANLTNIRSLMETMNWSSRQAMDALKIPASEQRKYEAKL